jgi:hypothetical protein
MDIIDSARTVHTIYMGRTYSNSDSVEIIIDDKIFDASKSFAEWFANNIYRGECVAPRGIP